MDRKFNSDLRRTINRLEKNCKAFDAGEAPTPNALELYRKIAALRSLLDKEARAEQRLAAKKRAAAKSAAGKPALAVGMAASLGFGSDSAAGTIISVTANGARFVVQRDTSIRVGDGPFELGAPQDYTYTPNKYGATYTFYRDKHGVWQASKIRGVRVTVGVRRTYHDPSF